MRNSGLIRLLALTVFTMLISVRVANAAGHTNVAHYTFPNTNKFTQDVSTNGNNVGLFGGNGGQYYITNTPKEGPFAAFFSFTPPFTAAYMGPPTNLLPVLARSFTISLWLKTSDIAGNDTDDGAFDGEGIFSTQYTGGSANDLIPMVLTGSKLSFITGGPTNRVLHSLGNINTGSYVHVAVTRNQLTGQKRIFINGALDNSTIATTNLLNAPNEIRVGATFNFKGFNGFIDDIQIYSGVLASSEISSLYNNPGVRIADRTNDIVEGSLGDAVESPSLPWTTGGDANWTYQTSITHDGVDAAAGGVIGEGDYSYIQTTVPSDGEFSFYWKVSSLEDFDYLTFYINDDYQDSISGDLNWFQETYEVFAGDVLRWEYTKDFEGDDGADRGWLDQAIFTPSNTNPPVSATFRLIVVREQSPSFGDIFYAFPELTSVDPAPVTEHVLISPTGKFNSAEGSQILNSLSQMIDELTNAAGWTIYIDKDDPGERQFNFKMSVSNLTTNLLKAAIITSPTNGAANVVPMPLFQWAGPSNYSTLSLIAFAPSTGTDGFTNLAVTATNWPGGPPFLFSGTNRFQATYESNNAVQVSTTTPLENGTTPISSWTTSTKLRSVGDSQFSVTAPTATLLTNVESGAGTVQFSFQTQTGRPYFIESNTNLTTTDWVLVTNIAGSGSMQQVTFPAVNPPENYYRVRAR